MVDIVLLMGFQTPSAPSDLMTGLELLRETGHVELALFLLGYLDGMDEKGMAAKIFPASVYDLTVPLHREHSLLNVRGYLNAHQEQGSSSPKRVSCEI